MKKEILSIKKVRLSRLNNAEYLRIMRLFSERIHSTGLEPLGIDADDLAAFDKNIAILNDLLVQSRTSKETAEMLDTDHNRDQAWVFILQAIRTYAGSPIANYQRAGKVLLEQTKPYTGNHTIANNQQTEQVHSLLMDLAKPENKVLVTLLGLDEPLKELQRLNDQYDQLSKSRTDSKLGNKLPPSFGIRKEMDEQYNYFTTLLFAKNTIAPTDILEGFILWLNKTIDEITADYNRRTAIGTTTSTPEENTSTTIEQ